MMFSSFSSAVLLLHNQTQSICAILNEKTWNELHVDTCWPRDKIQDGGEYKNICTIFSLPDLSTFVQRSHKINE